MSTTTCEQCEGRGYCEYLDELGSCAPGVTRLDTCNECHGAGTIEHDEEGEAIASLLSASVTLAGFAKTLGVSPHIALKAMRKVGGR